MQLLNTLKIKAATKYTSSEGVQTKPFIKIVQKILVANYKPITCICRKIVNNFIINLPVNMNHHLQSTDLIHIFRMQAPLNKCKARLLKTPWWQFWPKVLINADQISNTAMAGLWCVGGLEQATAFLFWHCIVLLCNNNSIYCLASAEWHEKYMFFE